MRGPRRRQRKRKRGGDQRRERHQHQRAFDSDTVGDHADESTASPPMPHANPIISDDTVAAEIGAIVCAKVTLTGSVDCSRKPPAAIIATIDQPSRSGAMAKKGTAATSDRTMSRRAPN